MTRVQVWAQFSAPTWDYIEDFSLVWNDKVLPKRNIVPRSTWQHKFLMFTEKFITLMMNTKALAWPRHVWELFRLNAKQFQFEPSTAYHTPFNQRRPCDMSEGRGANENFVLLLGVMKTKLKNQKESFLGSWTQMRGRRVGWRILRGGRFENWNFIAKKFVFQQGAVSADRVLFFSTSFQLMAMKLMTISERNGAGEMKKKINKSFHKILSVWMWRLLFLGGWILFGMVAIGFEVFSMCAFIHWTCFSEFLKGFLILKLKEKTLWIQNWFLLIAIVSLFKIENSSEFISQNCSSPS